MESNYNLHKAIKVMMSEKEPEPELEELLEEQIPKPKKIRKKTIKQLFVIPKK